MRRIITFSLVTAAMFSLAACTEPVAEQSGDDIQNQKQEQLTKQGVQSVGLPAIVNFQEKRLMKDILELRDNPKLVTYTYTQDMNGRYHKVCDSIGYGLPYATQYTNPQVDAFYTSQQEGAHIAMPQADPNGLYSPPQADGTWILCKVPDKDKVEPQYVEPPVFVMTFPLSN